MRTLHRLSLLLCAIGCGGASSESRVRPSSFVEARAFNPLEACNTTDFGRFSRSVVCRDTYLTFISRDLSAGALLESKRATLQAYGVTSDARTLLVGGRERQALGYALGAFETAAAAVLFTPLEYGASEAIEAQCYHYGGPVDPKRCSSLLNAFVEQGLTRGEWPSVLASRDPQTALSIDMFGREVKLPGACDEFGPFDVDCRQGHVRMLVLEKPELAEQAKAADIEAGAEGTLLQDWTTPCSVEGVETTCSVHRYRIPFDELFVYRVALVVKGTPLMLACEARKGRSEHLPGPICAQFLSFEPEALEIPKRPGEEE